MSIYKEAINGEHTFQPFVSSDQKARQSGKSPCISHELWSRVGILLLGLGVLNCPSSLLFNCSSFGLIS